MYSPFLQTIREKHPNTPILAITPIFATSELTHNMQNEGMRELIRRAVAQRIAAGDKNIQLIEGTDLVGPTGAMASPMASTPTTSDFGGWQRAW